MKLHRIGGLEQPNCTWLMARNVSEIAYDTSTGALYYDADGSAAAGPAVQFAALVGHPALAATDILTL